jgi:hypothetical protein
MPYGNTARMSAPKACYQLQRQFMSSAKIVHPAHFIAAQFRTEGRTAEFPATFWYRISNVIRTLLELRKIRGTIRIAEVE